MKKTNIRKEINNIFDLIELSSNLTKKDFKNYVNKRFNNLK